MFDTMQSNFLCQIPKEIFPLSQTFCTWCKEKLKYFSNPILGLPSKDFTIITPNHLERQDNVTTEITQKSVLYSSITQTSCRLDKQHNGC